MHVDAASGGFVAPFLQPDLVWDFRLAARAVDQRLGPQVRARLSRASAGRSGATQAALPEDLVFDVNYLGGNMPTFALNFSRPGSEVIAQYFMFARLGREGYRARAAGARATSPSTSRARSPRSGRTG